MIGWRKNGLSLHWSVCIVVVVVVVVVELGVFCTCRIDGTVVVGFVVVVEVVVVVVVVGVVE